MDAVTVTMAGLILAAIGLAISKDFRDVMGRAALPVRRWIFRQFVDGWSVLAVEEARQIATAVLAGDILEAVPYHNFGGEPQIAVLRRASQVDTDCEVHVIERLGKAYRAMWSSGLVIGRPSLQVQDIDGDGFKELLFVEESFGTGAGMRVLYVYCSRNAQLHCLTEHFNWQDAAGPASPVVTIEPRPEHGLGQAIITAAEKRGFLKPTRVDFDRAEFAIQRWHAENGTRREGEVRLHFYPGPPQFRSSTTAEIETTSGQWIAYFKGPVVLYDRSTDQHTVVFSPAWIYEWPTCLCTDSETVFWGIAGKAGLMACRVLGDRAELRYLSRVHDVTLPEVTQVGVSGSSIVMNNALPIRIAELWLIPWEGHQASSSLRSLLRPEP